MIYDADIREPLFEFLEETYGKIRILEEVRTGSSIADAIMIKPLEICGIEIKSDADSYLRLKGQVKNYDEVYDRNYAVVGTTHAHHIKEHVPEHWGIITVEQEEGRLDFYILREARENQKASLKRKLELLWRPELKIIQQSFDMPKYDGKSKIFVREKILEKVPEEKLRGMISELLFERDYTELVKTIEEYREAKGLKKRRKRKRRSMKKSIRKYT